AAAVGTYWRSDRPQARLLRPSATEDPAVGPRPQHEFHPLRHSHRRRRGGYRRSAALRCAARSRHGDGGGNFPDASRGRDRRFRTKPHRHGRGPRFADPHTDAFRVPGLPPKVPRFDSFPRLAYVNALFIIGTIGTLITPAMLDGWAQLHWSATRLGAVAAIELAGLAAGSLSGLYWQRRWRWRQVALPSILVAIAGNAACVVVKDFAGVCVLRALVGVSGGFLTALYSAVLANSRSPGRVIAVTTFIQIGVEAAFMFSTASVFARLGSSGLFVLMAGLFIALLPFLTLLPPQWPTATAADTRDIERSKRSWRAYP